MNKESIAEAITALRKKALTVDPETGYSESDMELQEFINAQSVPLVVSAANASKKIIQRMDNLSPEWELEKPWDSGEILQSLLSEAKDASYDIETFNKLMDSDVRDVDRLREVYQTPYIENSGKFAEAMEAYELAKAHYAKRKAVKRLFLNHVTKARAQPTSSNNVLVIVDSDPSITIDKIRLTTTSVAEWCFKHANTRIPEWELQSKTEIRMGGPIMEAMQYLYHEEWVNGKGKPTNESMTKSLKEYWGNKPDFDKIFSGKVQDVMWTMLRSAAKADGIKK